jgi:hypothetical protein
MYLIKEEDYEDDDDHEHAVEKDPDASVKNDDKKSS